MSKTQIYIGNDLLDFDGVFNVKRQVNDYRDLSIGSSVKSYTIDIPLTPGNTQKLKYINDLRSIEEVDDTARIISNGVELIAGKPRIMSFVTLYAKMIIEADDWIDDVKGISIKDLSWSDPHTFTSDNVEDSWTAGAGAFYRYPLINFASLYSEERQVDAHEKPDKRPDH